MSRIDDELAALERQARTDVEVLTALRISAVAGLQPQDSDLTAIAALTTTTFGRSLLTLADAAALAAAHAHSLAQVTDVTMSVANLNTLDDGVTTALHFHDADRARAVHTGTQAAATISDFDTQVRTSRLDQMAKPNTNLVLPNTSGIGLQVDTTTPTFGWRDITSDISVRGSGASNPIWTQYNGTSIYGYVFSKTGTTEAWVNFHIPHDWEPASEMHIHAHWSQTTADAGKAVQWNFDVLFARGFDQQAFPAAVTSVVAAQNCSSTVRQHMIAEVQLTTSGAIGGNTVEVDGIILVRVWRDAALAGDTSTQDAFLHFVDLHYQSTNMATKNKAPNFYS